MRRPVLMDSLTLPSFEHAVRAMAARSGVSLPTARAVLLLRARLIREGRYSQDEFTTALRGAAEAGEAWAREAFASGSGRAEASHR